MQHPPGDRILHIHAQRKPGAIVGHRNRGKLQCGPHRTGNGNAVAQPLVLQSAPRHSRIAATRLGLECQLLAWIERTRKTRLQRDFSPL